ncbi:MAG: outer membrane lipoprotein carrier protein LolA [Succinatimonas sp.]|nr:outer membrane lipoprotein carrier protein LolA [Succinatimonas sp.]MCI7025621.1 outer membrane lipoprotein carrier protein LolA [Succinatimonas sp.]MDD6756330.1 outer membrane lipoprotein carrier protein LolA [Succinatimonas sp.]MDY6246731.1 outer membrane lipoprotein carrier protein LolA [Succinivibrio sp.]MDY6261117.1 outer membrane lipoprotein carrier protein LolA [Succinivibrio sp.]
MNKLFKFLFVFIALAFSFNTNALTVNELSALLQKDANFKASYKQEKTLNKLNKILKSSGVVIIIENKNVFFRQNTPFELEQIITPNRFAQIMDDEINEITRDNNPQLFEISNLLLNIFSMNEVNEKYFSYKLSGNLNNWTIEMKPNDELLSKIFNKITIQGSDKVKEIVIEDVSKDTTKLTFSDYSTDKITLNVKEQSYLVK